MRQIMVVVLVFASVVMGGTTTVVLIDGGGLQDSRAYSRDIERAYHVAEGFADRIIVHQTDGQDPNADSAYLLGFWSGTNYQYANPAMDTPRNDSVLAATAGLISNTFGNLSEQLTPADNLVVLVVGHGHFQTGGIWLQDGPLNPEVFVSMLDSVDCPQTVVLAQCYAEAHIPAAIAADREIVYSEGVIVDLDEVVYWGGPRDGEVVEGQTPWMTQFLAVYDGTNPYASFIYAQENDPYGPMLGPAWKAIYPGGPGTWMTETMHHIPEPSTMSLLLIGFWIRKARKR